MDRNKIGKTVKSGLNTWGKKSGCKPILVNIESSSDFFLATTNVYTGINESRLSHK